MLGSSGQLTEEGQLIVPGGKESLLYPTGFEQSPLLQATNPGWPLGGGIHMSR